MTLYEFMMKTGCDYDTYDDEFDAAITVTFDPESEDDIDRFIIKLSKLVEVKGTNYVGDPVCDWSEMIRRNLPAFREFAKEHWYKGNHEDDDDFIFEWFDELHNWIAGYLPEDEYSMVMEELIDKCN